MAAMGDIGNLISGLRPPTTAPAGPPSSASALFSGIPNLLSRFGSTTAAGGTPGTPKGGLHGIMGMIHSLMSGGHDPTATFMAGHGLSDFLANMKKLNDMVNPQPMAALGGNKNPLASAMGMMQGRPTPAAGRMNFLQ